MNERIVFGANEDDGPDFEEQTGPAADPEEDGDDWDDRPRAPIAKLPEPPPQYSIVPAGHDDAIELDEELQFVADMKQEMAWIKKGKPSQRALAAVRMDSFGFPWPQIAKRLMFPTPRAAFEAATGAIASLVPSMDIRTARDRHSMRLEMMLSSLLPRAMDTKSSEQVAYSKQAAEVLRDLARLHGTNAPTQLQVSTPDAEEFNKAVMTIFEARNPDLPRELDVFAPEEDEGETDEEAEADS